MSQKKKKKKLFLQLPFSIVLKMKIFQYFFSNLFFLAIIYFLNNLAHPHNIMNFFLMAIRFPFHELLS